MLHKALTPTCDCLDLKDRGRKSFNADLYKTRQREALILIRLREDLRLIKLREDHLRTRPNEDQSKDNLLEALLQSDHRNKSPEHQIP